MNLKSTLSFIALSIAMQATAQNVTRESKTHQLLHKKHKPAANHVAAKSTATLSRLVAVASLMYNEDSTYFVIADSTHVSYSGDRGGDLNSEWVKFDTGVNYTNNGSGLENGNTFSQTFDGNDNILTSTQKEWNGTAFINYSKSLYAYDGNNNLLEEKYLEWNTGSNSWDSVDKYTYTYNGNNNMLTEVDMTWDGSAWENSAQYAYTYNVNNYDSLVIMQSWNGTAWENNMRTTMLYDLNNIVLTQTSETWNGTVWVNSYRNTNAVVAGNIATSTSQFWMTNSWQDMYKSDYTYDGNGNNLVEVGQQWNGTAFENSRKVMRAYNSYNQITSEQDSSWNGTVWANQTYDSWGRYYYETHTTSVNNVSSLSADVKVYPVPAQNHVTIALTQDAATDITVSVIDMQGRLMKTFSEKNTTSFSRSVDTRAFAAGTYFVKISGNGKAAYQQFSVVH